MIKTGHLETYDVILTVRTPLHIGSGHVINKQEYVYDPRSKRSLSANAGGKAACFGI